MGKRILSFIVIVSLCASTIVGALGLSLRFVYADDAPAENIVSLSDIKDFLSENVTMTTEELSGFNYLFNFMQSNIDSHYCFISVVSDGLTFNFNKFKISIITTNSWGNWVWANDDEGNFYCQGGNFEYFANVGTIYYNNGTFNIQNVQGSYRIGRFNNAIDWNNQTQYFAVSSRTLADNSNFIWCNHQVISRNGIPIAFDNLQWETVIPPIIEYELILFWLGERRYLTIKDQSLIRQLNGGGQMEYVLVIESPFDDQGDFDLLSYQYSNLTRLQYTGIEDRLENISPSGVYAIDITDLDWDEIHDSVIYDFVDSDNPELVCQCTNVPLNLHEVAPEPGSNGTPDSYTTMWQEFNTYVNNYNLSPVVPDSLSSSLFGVSGLQCYPVSVASPHQSLTTWKWWTNQTNLGINFELMDVCIIEAGIDYYTLVYFYDSTLQTAFMPVENFYINELFDKFDCVIIVPDAESELDKGQWWKDIIQYLVDSLNLDFHFEIQNHFAVSGTSSLGVEYVASQPSNATVILQGYCFVTPKGVQRQQLYNFSDGITKFYKLMSDYVESEDNWKTSFLQWTSSWFSAINTLNGSINGLAAAISKLDFSGIEDKLDRLIENTNEEESNFWYIPLWNFIRQFEPAAEDFVEGLQVYDNNWNNLPLLSPVPTIPLLPTISLGGG